MLTNWIYEAIYYQFTEYGCGNEIFYDTGIYGLVQERCVQETPVR